MPCNCHYFVLKKWWCHKWKQNIRRLLRKLRPKAFWTEFLKKFVWWHFWLGSCEVHFTFGIRKGLYPDMSWSWIVVSVSFYAHQRRKQIWKSLKEKIGFLGEKKNEHFSVMILFSRWETKNVIIETYNSVRRDKCGEKNFVIRFGTLKSPLLEEKKVVSFFMGLDVSMSFSYARVFFYTLYKITKPKNNFTQVDTWTQPRGLYILWCLSAVARLLKLF